MTSQYTLWQRKRLPTTKAHTMNSDQIFDVIEQVAADPSKKAKEAILAKYKDDKDFRDALYYCYNPNFTYGMKKLPPCNPAWHGDSLFDTAPVYELLDNLRTRKLTGNSAQSAVQGMLESLTEKSATLLSRIILQDMRAGIDSTINKAIKDLIPEFAYNRCSGMDKLGNVSLPAYSQEKMDAMYANCDVLSTDVIYFSSRSGKEIPTTDACFKVLLEDIQQSFPVGWRLEGELIVEELFGEVWKPLERQISNGIVNHISKGEGGVGENQRISYVVWNIVPLENVAKGKDDQPYSVRLGQLTSFIGLMTRAISVVPTRVVSTLKEAFEHCAELLKEGKEGTILKAMGTLWKDGTSTDKIKMKLKFQVELKVVGFTKGEGKNASTFGALRTESSCHLLKVDVASGLKDKASEGVTRQQILDEWLDWEGGIITVEANGVNFPSKSNNHYSLSLPVFIERRFDKKVADDVPTIIAQRDSAILSASVTGQKIKVKKKK